MNIAILTQKEYLDFQINTPYVCQLQYEESMLLHGFSSLGVNATRVAWDDPKVKWHQFDAAIFRTTWDYFHRYDEFSSWLTKVSQQTRLMNSPRVLHWNIDKHYLAEMASKGVDIVPTHFVEKGDKSSLIEHCQKAGITQGVFKPVISGGARLTHRFNLLNGPDISPIFAEAVANESMMIQPFIESVARFGEVSIIVIDGKYSHAVRKMAKPGDFRVQDDHGGIVVGYEPSEPEIALAERAIAASPELPLYARVDMVKADSGSWQIMELELIEPELFFRFFSPGAQRLCDAAARLLRA